MSNRQREILNLLAQGLTNKQIAKKLGIAEGTVKCHIQYMLRSSSTKTRTELVFRCFIGEEGLKAPIRALEHNSAQCDLPLNKPAYSYGSPFSG